MIFSTDAGLFPAARLRLLARSRAPVIKPGCARWWAMRDSNPRPGGGERTLRELAWRRRTGVFSRSCNQSLCQSPMIRAIRRGRSPPAVPSLIYGVGGRRSGERRIRRCSRATRAVCSRCPVPYLRRGRSPSVTLCSLLEHPTEKNRSRWPVAAWARIYPGFPSAPHAMRAGCAIGADPGSCTPDSGLSCPSDGCIICISVLPVLSR